MEFIVEKAPHLRRKASVASMMLDVIIALMPVTIFSLVVYELSALMIILVSVITMLIAEFIFVGLKNIGPYDGIKRTFSEKFKKSYKNYTVNNILSPIVSGLIFAMIMPASATWYHVLIGSLFGIVFGKLVFGGLGGNLFNPAAVGRIFSGLCFGSTWTYSSTKFFEIPNGTESIITGGTPLTQLGDNLLNINHYSILDLFIGNVPGAIGETSAICILLGLIYLLIRRSVDFRVVLSNLFTFTVLIFFAGISLQAPNILKYMLYHILSGGLLFGMTFMITDPVTSPVTRPGRMLFGSLIAALTILIRLFGSYPEGVAYSILIANAIVPVIDYFRWATNKYNYKHFIIYIGMIGIISLFIFIGL